MKKFFLTAIVAVALISSSFAAPVKNINSRVATTFESNFREATNVKWELKADFAKATFVNDGVATEAFYNLNGDFLGSSQAVSLDKLPTPTKRAFAKKYGSYTVKEAIKFNGADETAYYIAAENDKQSVILKVTDGYLEVFKVTNRK